MQQNVNKNVFISYNKHRAVNDNVCSRVFKWFLLFHTPVALAGRPKTA